MKCPVCFAHTTSFANLMHSDVRFYMMPFVRTCPPCGAKLRLGTLSFLCFLGLLLSLHALVEVAVFIARRFGFDPRSAVLDTLLILAIPFCSLVYLLWKHGTYTRR